jgi:hypothetical protein
VKRNIILNAAIIIVMGHVLIAREEEKLIVRKIFILRGGTYILMMAHWGN